MQWGQKEGVQCDSKFFSMVNCKGFQCPTCTNIQNQLQNYIYISYQVWSHKCSTFLKSDAKQQFSPPCRNWPICEGYFLCSCLQLSIVPAQRFSFNAMNNNLKSPLFVILLHIYNFVAKAAKMHARWPKMRYFRGREWPRGEFLYLQYVALENKLKIITSLWHFYFSHLTLTELNR